MTGEEKEKEAETEAKEEEAKEKEPETKEPEGSKSVSKEEDASERDKKVKDRMGFLRRKPDELQKLVEMEVDVEDMRSELNATRRELDIERAMKKEGLDEEAASLISGNTREEIFASASKVRVLLDKASEKKDGEKKSAEDGEKERIENPDLKDAEDIESGDNRATSEKAILKRYEEAREILKFDA